MRIIARSSYLFLVGSSASIAVCQAESAAIDRDDRARLKFDASDASGTTMPLRSSGPPVRPGGIPRRAQPLVCVSFISLSSVTKKLGLYQIACISHQVGADFCRLQTIFLPILQ